MYGKIKVPNIRRLIALCYSVRLGSMSEAALRLGVSKPTMSEHIKVLSDDLNEDLFIRVSHKTYEPSVFARRFAEEISPAIEELVRLYNLAASGEWRDEWQLKVEKASEPIEEPKKAPEGLPIGESQFIMLASGEAIAIPAKKTRA